MKWYHIAGIGGAVALVAILAGGKGESEEQAAPVASRPPRHLSEGELVEVAQVSSPDKAGAALLQEYEATWADMMAEVGPHLETLKDWEA